MADTVQPGALAADWAHWQGLGLTEDLLPVVSDLSAAISANSTLKSLGKTPSLINRSGFAVGIPQWTQKRAADGEIGRWAQDMRLGICIQCRWLRALDLDLADENAVRDTTNLIFLITGELPVRYRTNSSKCLLVFFMAGEFVKRVIHTAHGAIEFLANGQQFIAVGTHPSGVRYEWKGGLPTSIPEVSPAEFAILWQTLQDTYGTEPERVARGGLARPAVTRTPNATVDDVTNFMDTNGWVKSWVPDGRVNINCPWEDEHSEGAGNETSTQYFPAGVGGFALGHFRCLHAHCVGRTDSDFLEAIKYMDGEFDDLTKPGTATAADGTAVATLPVAAPPAPAYVRTRSGEVLANSNNMTMALERPDQCGMRIQWDAFKDEIMLASPDPGVVDWRPFRDHDYLRLRNHLQLPLSRGGANFKDIGRELVRDVVHFVAATHQMDSATLWAQGLKWDGVARVQRFFHTYFRAVDNPYTRAVAMYAWSALAGRALVPGVKADMAVILKSEQGTVKTEGIAAMAPHPDMFAEVDLTKPDDALARLTRGKLVVEISELRGLNSREHGAIKAWVSRRFEEWVPKFKEFATKFPRRFIAFGTTNEDEFLADSTGERRWLPMEVGRTDLEALKRDCEQLWAEGVHIFKTKGGVQWREAEELAKYEHGRFKVQDSWHDVVVGWLNEEAFGDVEGVRQGDFPLRVHHVLQSALGMNTHNITRKDELRVTHVLRSQGYFPTTVRAKTDVFRAWVHSARVERARMLREAHDDLG
jgi:predicted P-loop ATPase